ncbi:hypothetical protein B0E43_13800 [Algoriphagus sp. A40]|nr:hypothetical protein B0E43_13800 [Algoriphagus sp. A40]
MSVFSINSNPLLFIKDQEIGLLLISLPLNLVYRKKNIRHFDESKKHFPVYLLIIGRIFN